MTWEEQTAFYGSLHDLAAVFRVRLNDAQALGYWKALADLNLRAVCGAMEECAKSDERFPVPAAIKKRCYQREPRGVTVALPLPKRGASDHATAAMALIKRITSERMKPQQRRAEFVKMAAKFPGVGWEDAIAEVDRLIEKQERRA